MLKITFVWVSYLLGKISVRQVKPCADNGKAKTMVGKVAFSHVSSQTVQLMATLLHSFLGEFDFVFLRI